MIQDKYIGLLISVSSSVAIGTSFIITKKGLIDAAKRNESHVTASENLTYLKNPIWWSGTMLMVLGEIGNFAAYSFAPAILITPLGFLSVLIGAVLASIFLHEELGHIGRIGCSLCILGAIIIVAHAPSDKEVTTVDEILIYAVHPGFLMYCFTVLAGTLILIYNVAPRYGTKNPMVYMSICSLAGSLTVMASKGFGIAIRLTLNGNNQFSHPSTYVFGIVCAVCILVQMAYFNKALDTFSTNVVNPIYYVTFTTATIIASLILFQGFNTTDAVGTISLIDGFLITFFGVHLLNQSIKPSPARESANGLHIPLENGLMTPRISLSDGWGHGRRRSDSAGRYGRRSGSMTLFNAYDNEQRERQLEHLEEAEGEEYWETDATELTKLRNDRDASPEERRQNSRIGTPRGDRER